MGFPRQEYWSELPFLSPGNLPDTGIKPASLAWQVDSLPWGHLESPSNIITLFFFFFLPTYNRVNGENSTEWVIMFNVHLVLTGSSFKVELCRQGEKAMAPYSSTLAWKIPWAEEPGRLQSIMESWGVGHDWATSLSLFTFMHWRKWQPTPVFLPGESQGQRSLVGCRLWGHTELDTEAT